MLSLVAFFFIVSAESPLRAQEEQIVAIAPVKAFTIIAEKYSFQPSVIRVNKGDRVKLTLISKDTSHGFKLKGYNINVKIRPKIPHTVDFVANKAGTFKFKCSKFCGWGHFFMKGKLIVRETKEE